MVGSSDPMWIVEHLLLDSLLFLKLLPSSVRAVADLGSGAGSRPANQDRSARSISCSSRSGGRCSFQAPFELKLEERSRSSRAAARTWWTSFEGASTPWSCAVPARSMG